MSKLYDCKYAVAAVFTGINPIVWELQLD